MPLLWHFHHCCIKSLEVYWSWKWHCSFYIISASIHLWADIWDRLSSIIFIWLTPLIYLRFKNPCNMKDLYNLHVYFPDGLKSLCLQSYINIHLFLNNLFQSDKESQDVKGLWDLAMCSWRQNEEDTSKRHFFWIFPKPFNIYVPWDSRTGFVTAKPSMEHGFPQGKRVMVPAWFSM